MKTLLRIAGVLVLLLIVALVAVYFFAGAIIRPIVESTAGKSLGVPTTLGGADLYAFAGNLKLSDLNVSNPKPFDTDAPQFVAFKTCSVTLQPSSLLGARVKIDEIKIDGLTLCMDQHGIESNIMAIMNNLKAASGTSQGGSKELDIDHILLTNTRLVVRLGGVPGLKAQGTDFTLDSLRIDRPMDPDGRAPRLANLMGQILAKVAAQAADDPRLPQELRGVLGNVSNLGKNLGKSLQDVTKGVLENPKGAIDNLGNLFKNKKKDPGMK